jgi:hypothetical protein
MSEDEKAGTHTEIHTRTETHKHIHTHTRTETQHTHMHTHAVSALHKIFPLKAHVSVIRYARNTEVNFDKTLQNLISCVVLS